MHAQSAQLHGAPGLRAVRRHVNSRDLEASTDLAARGEGIPRRAQQPLGKSDAQRGPLARTQRLLDRPGGAHSVAVDPDQGADLHATAFADALDAERQDAIAEAAVGT